MKRVSLIWMLVIITTSCTSYSKISDKIECDENIEFKRDFFYNLSIVEKYTFQHRKSINLNFTVADKQLIDAYDFLSKTSNLKLISIANYEIGYVSYEAFELDKKKLLRWYQSNKCSGLVKKNYGDNFSFKNILQHFHTHPGGKLRATDSEPEISQDVNGMRNNKPQIPNASFILLYRIPGQVKLGEYDYTHNWLKR